MVEKSANCSLRLRFISPTVDWNLGATVELSLLGHNKPIDHDLSGYNLVLEGNYRKVFGLRIANAS